MILVIPPSWGISWRVLGGLLGRGGGVVGLDQFLGGVVIGVGLEGGVVLLVLLLLMLLVPTLWLRMGRIRVGSCL